MDKISNSEISINLRLLYDRGYRLTKDGKFIIKPDNEKHKVVSKNRIGYFRFGLRDAGGKRTAIPIHRFQSFIKYGVDSLKVGVHTRHLDGDPLNNHWDNIAIGTHSENMMDKSKEERVRSAKIATRAMQNMLRPKEERLRIYKYLKEGKSYNWIIENTCMTSKGTLSYMKNKSQEYKEFCKK